MNEHSASVTEVARHFADYINRVAYRGERFVLTRGNRPVAELGPVPGGMQLRELPDLLRSLPRLTEKEAETFARDLKETRHVVQQEALRDPWES